MTITVFESILIIFLYFIGWFISRGANLQKYYYRINSKDKNFLFGLIKQKVI